MEQVNILRTEVTPLASIRPHPENARRGSDRAVEKSLRNFGQFAPLIVQESTGHILKGNNTYRVMRDRLDKTHAQVMFVSCSDKTARAILAVDNRTSDLATYDDGGLAALLQQVENDGLLSAVGYDNADLLGLLAKLDPPPPIEPPEEPAKTPMPDPPPTTPAAPREPAESRSGFDDAAATRMLAVNYSPPMFTWVLDRLEELRAEWELDTNADMIVALISEASAQDPPSCNRPVAK